MTYAQSFLPEFDQEMASTRKVLALVPSDRMDWKPGESFQTVGWNANHLAEMVGWVAPTMASPVWEVAPEGSEPYKSPNETTTEGLLALFDNNVREAREALSSVSDENFNSMWALQKAGATLFSMPKSSVVRVWVLNHTIHHRAHLLVYLRLLGINVPGMYGPGHSDKNEF